MNADQKQTVRELIAEIQIRLDFLKTVVNAEGTQGDGFATRAGNRPVETAFAPGKNSPDYSPVTIRRRKRGINWPS